MSIFNLNGRMFFTLLTFFIVISHFGVQSENVEIGQLWAFGDGSTKFDNHKLYSAALSSNLTEVSKLLRLREKLDIDFWNEPEPNGKVNFRVSPPYQSVVEEYLNASSINYSVITDNLQRWIDRERLENAQTSDFLIGRGDVTSIALDHYHTYQEIYTWLEKVEARYPHLVELKTIGKTFENHDIRVVKLGLPAEKGNATTPSTGRKGVFWIDAGIHAREVSPSG